MPKSSIHVLDALSTLTGNVPENRLAQEHWGLVIQHARSCFLHNSGPKAAIKQLRNLVCRHKGPDCRGANEVLGCGRHKLSQDFETFIRPDSSNNTVTGAPGNLGYRQLPRLEYELNRLTRQSVLARLITKPARVPE